MMNRVQTTTTYSLGKRSDRMSHGQRLTVGLGAVTTTSTLPHDSATVAPYSVAESFFLSKTSGRTPLASGPRWLNPDDTLKRWLKRIMPDPRELLKNPQLSVFGRRLQDPNLWHLNRRTASGAFALGLFMMYVPLPGQMFWAGWMAILLRLNLSISVLLCLITNPLTIPPIYYFSYLLGSWLLGQSPRGFDLGCSICLVFGLFRSPSFRPFQSSHIYL